MEEKHAEMKEEHAEMKEEHDRTGAESLRNKTNTKGDGGGKTDLLLTLGWSHWWLEWLSGSFGIKQNPTPCSPRCGSRGAGESMWVWKLGGNGQIAEMKALAKARAPRKSREWTILDDVSLDLLIGPGCRFQTPFDSRVQGCRPYSHSHGFTGKWLVLYNHKYKPTLIYSWIYISTRLLHSPFFSSIPDFLFFSFFLGSCGLSP